MNVVPRNFELPLAAYAAVWGTGFLSQTTSPHLIAVLVASRNLDEVQAGTVQTAELAVVAATALLLAPWMARLPKRPMAIGGALIAATAHLASATSDGMVDLIAFRVTAGFGAGFALAAGNAAIAASAEPERVYGRMLVILGLASLIVLVGMGYTAERWGTAGTYGFQAAWIIALLPLLWRLPAAVPSTAGEVAKIRRCPLVAALLLVTTLALFASADIAIWSFSGRIASSLGLDSRASGWAMGAGSLFAMVGGATAASLGARWGYARPIGLGLVLLSPCALTITSATGPAAFVMTLVLYQGLYMFLLAFLYGAAGVLDPDGRIMVGAAGAALLGAAAGPYLAGSLAGWRGYEVIGHYFVVAGVLSSLLVLIAVRFGENRIR